MNEFEQNNAIAINESVKSNIQEAVLHINKPGILTIPGLNIQTNSTSESIVYYFPILLSLSGKITEGVNVLASSGVIVPYAIIITISPT